jgi:hypothetical protein
MDLRQTIGHAEVIIEARNVDELDVEVSDDIHTWVRGCA